jgi:hypothetical protein
MQINNIAFFVAVTLKELSIVLYLTELKPRK